jgi:CheY-like chemotaxis protein
MVVQVAPPSVTRAEALPWRREGPRQSGPAGSGPSGLTPGNHEDEAQAAPDRIPRNLVGVKVLVVDDDQGTLEYFAAALDACGAAVTVTGSAREALRVIAGAAPDVIVSDIAMPGEDGYWLLREIRRLADGALRGVPVVAATAYGREHPRERTLAAGFAMHLTKPVDPVLLCRAVAAALGR